MKVELPHCCPSPASLQGHTWLLIPQTSVDGLTFNDYNDCFGSLVNGCARAGSRLHSKASPYDTIATSYAPAPTQTPHQSERSDATVALILHLQLFHQLFPVVQALEWTC